MIENISASPEYALSSMPYRRNAFGVLPPLWSSAAMKPSRSRIFSSWWSFMVVCPCLRSDPSGSRVSHRHPARAAGGRAASRAPAGCLCAWPPGRMRTSSISPTFAYERHAVLPGFSHSASGIGGSTHTDSQIGLEAGEPPVQPGARCTRDYRPSRRHRGRRQQKGHCAWAAWRARRTCTAASPTEGRARRLRRKGRRAISSPVQGRVR